MPFVDTENKAAIRRRWDLPVLERWNQQLGRELAYFGLTGPDIRDLRDWRNVLGLRTAVEFRGHNRKERDLADETIGRLHTNVMLHGLSSGFQLLVGDIETVLCDGVDDHGGRPQLSEGHVAHAASFRYDIVNLDFDGGLGYRDGRGAAKRVLAIKKLFERQRGRSFVLLVTINVRHKLGDEIDTYLREYQKLERGAGWRELLEWYITRGDGEIDYKLKALLPSFINAVAELSMFHCICRPPVSYVGHESAHMMHFVFELESRCGNLRTFGPHDDRDLIGLPLLRCDGGSIQLAQEQHPGFDAGTLTQHLDFLPAETVEWIQDNSAKVAMI